MHRDRMRQQLLLHSTFEPDGRLDAGVSDAKQCKVQQIVLDDLQKQYMRRQQAGTKKRLRRQHSALLHEMHNNSVGPPCRMGTGRTQAPCKLHACSKD